MFIYLHIFYREKEREQGLTRDANKLTPTKHLAPPPP